ncbi:MAG: SH3 domain-containing protein [Thiohalobacteraceae bacterium]
MLLAWALSGCALLQSPAPGPATSDCDPRDQEVARLQQTLAERDAEVQQLRAQQSVQATALKEITVEVARAEVKLRRLATQADAASRLAEAEVALLGMETEAQTPLRAAQIAEAQRLLDAGAESFAQGEYGAAVELAAESQAIIETLAGGGRLVPGVRDAEETPLHTPLALRTRVDSNLRAQPGRTEPVLSLLRQGTALQAHAYRGEWLHIHTDDGRAGWVYGPLLEAPNPPAE